MPSARIWTYWDISQDLPQHRSGCHNILPVQYLRHPLGVLSIGPLGGQIIICASSSVDAPRLAPKSCLPLALCLKCNAECLGARAALRDQRFNVGDACLDLGEFGGGAPERPECVPGDAIGG